MRFLLPLCLLVLAGVGCTQPTPVPRAVLVACPPPPVVHRPHLPIHGLRPGATPDEVALAYAQSIRLLQAYALELETLLDAHRPPRKPR